MICPEYLTEGLESHFRRIERERMQGLMDEENRDTLSTCEAEISRRWYGETPEEVAAQGQVAALGLDERLAQPISRRESLRGRQPRDIEP